MHTELQDVFTIATNALRSEKIDFALIGGFALAAHGVVRAIEDIDFLVDGSKKESAKASLLKSGFKLIKIYADLFDEWSFISELRSKL